LLEYLLQDPDAKKLRMEARRAAKEARLVERRKEKEENQKCKAIERYERDRRFAKSRAGVEMELQAFQYFSLEI
jgi:hypothetical protein